MNNYKNYFLLVLLSVAASFAAAVSASAHQPRYVPDNQLALIKNPEISQAFYGELKDGEADYLIEFKKVGDLYLQILEPDLPEIKKDKFATVEYLPELGARPADFAKLNVEAAEWKKYYEEFAGDSYWEGPSIKKPAESGYYLVKVSSPDNRGKYVLVVGEKEEFPAAEIVKALVTIPRLKMDFFNKPVWLWFNGKIGKYFLLSLSLAIIIGFMFRKFHQVYR